MLARTGTFRHLIGNNLPKLSHHDMFYLFYSPTLAKITGSFSTKLTDGKRVEYTEARDFKRLNEFTSFHQDSKFVGLGKYNPNKY